MVSFTTLFALLASTQAHLILTKPAPRGNDIIAQLTGPCGEGYDSPGERAIVEGGKLSFRLGVGDPDAQIDVNFATGDNPKTFPTKLFSQKYGKAGYQQIDLDFTKVSGITNGPATIQIINVAEDGIKYMCADLSLSGIAVIQTTTTVASVTTVVSVTTVIDQTTTINSETSVSSLSTSTSSSDSTATGIVTSATSVETVAPTTMVNATATSKPTNAGSATPTVTENYKEYSADEKEKGYVSTSSSLNAAVSYAVVAFLGALHLI